MGGIFCVHNSEVREELTESRDLFSEMDLSKMTKVDLYEMKLKKFMKRFSPLDLLSTKPMN